MVIVHHRDGAEVEGLIPMVQQFSTFFTGFSSGPDNLQHQLPVAPFPLLVHPQRSFTLYG